MVDSKTGFPILDGVLADEVAAGVDEETILGLLGSASLTAEETVNLLRVGGYNVSASTIRTYRRTLKVSPERLVSA